MKKLRKIKFSEDTLIKDWTGQKFAPAVIKYYHRMTRLMPFNACAILSKKVVKYY